MQPKFALQFSTGNAAFEDLGYAECSRILRKIAEQLDVGFVQAIIHDANGNHVDFRVGGAKKG